MLCVAQPPCGGRMEIKMDKLYEWEELKSENTKDEITAHVWNRDIKFKKSIFPSTVKIDGNEILHAPIELKAYFDGKIGEWEKQNVISLEKTDQKAVYAVSQTANDIIVNADITIEFDGFIRIDFRIIPFWNPAWIVDKPLKTTLTKLSIDVPLKNEFSTLCHYWPNCESAVCLSGRVLNSHETPEGEMKLPFKPYIWSGWEYGGLGICCESDKNFELNDKDECITITRNSEYTNINISLLDYLPEDWHKRADIWGNTLKPITYSFAFQPTPVKEFDKNSLKEWRAFHLADILKKPAFDAVYGNDDTLIKRIAASGAKWLILHEDWTVIQNYGLAYDENAFKEFVNKCHKLGLKVMVYFGYEISTLYHDFNSICDESLNKNVNGNFVGGWQREPMQRDYTVCYAGKYSDVMLERVKYAMDNYGVDGIYTDGTYIPWECANEAHGCGWHDAKGELHCVYPIYAVRDHVKKLYEIVHSRGGRIDTHQSSCCMTATLGFADSYYDGENIQGFLKEDISNLKTDTFRTEFMGLNMGIPCQFISYTEDNYTMRMLSGNTLIHNVFPRATHIEDLDYISQLWQIYDDFGTDTAEWRPYWEKQDVSADNRDTYLSYYKKDDSLLLIINSFDKNISECEITLDGEYSFAEDLLDGGKIKVSGKKLIVNINFAEVKLIKVTK